MAIQIAETARSRATQKALSHLEIHPLARGTMVRHVYHSPVPSKEFMFNEEGKGRGGEHIISHLMKHANLPALEPGAQHEEKTEEAEAE
jgi:hypothetical protein